MSSAMIFMVGFCIVFMALCAMDTAFRCRGAGR